MSIKGNQRATGVRPDTDFFGLVLLLGGPQPGPMSWSISGPCYVSASGT